MSKICPEYVQSISKMDILISFLNIYILKSHVSHIIATSSNTSNGGNSGNSGNGGNTTPPPTSDDPGEGD